MSTEWANPERVDEYLAREIPHRKLAEDMLREALPKSIGRVLDLGTGDGRLLALVRQSHPGAEAIGLDTSKPMLDKAADRFAGAVVELRSHDLREPLAEPGPFDAIVSGLAIHHLDHPRKRQIFSEIHSLLSPAGVFANLDLVSSATPGLHERFRREIGRVKDDPTDQLANLSDQMNWLRRAGFSDVDCHFKWLEMALVVAVKDTY